MGLATLTNFKFLDLATSNCAEERKKERMTNGHFFEHLVLAYTIELMNDLGLIR